MGLTDEDITRLLSPKEGMAGHERNNRTRAKKCAVIKWFKMNQGCKVCGEKRPQILDLHHRDSSDKNPILKDGTGKQGRPIYFLSWADLIEELQKCDILCANCHRLHEFNKKKGKFDELVELMIEELDLDSDSSNEEVTCDG